MLKYLFFRETFYKWFYFFSVEFSYLANNRSQDLTARKPEMTKNNWHPKAPACKNSLIKGFISLISWGACTKITPNMAKPFRNVMYCRFPTCFIF